MHLDMHRRERQLEGIADAKARGVYKGRKAPKRKGPPERPMVRKASKAFAVPCQFCTQTG
ncbi:MAG: hypothetical protein E6G82_15590 [Alphaproteobacteria bacterium]|nr:MAG: hypothetical protein E6G82_15590 [Alphaproteobacteria bacterium]